MVNERKLNKDVSSFLKGEQVVSVGIVVIHVEFGKGKILPVAAGVGVTAAVDGVENICGFDGGVADTIAIGAGVVTKSRVQHQIYKKEAQKQGLTPVMICAITDSKIYFLDWNGNVRSGTGPTRILLEFDRKSATVNVNQTCVHTDITISEGGVTVTSGVMFGLLSANKSMNGKMVNQLDTSVRLR